MAKVAKAAKAAKGTRGKMANHRRHLHTHLHASLHAHAAPEADGADAPPAWLALLAMVEKEDPDVVCLQGLPDGGAGVMKWLTSRSLVGHVSEGGGLTPGAVTGPSEKGGPKGPGEWSYLYPGRVATFSRVPMKSVAFHRTLGSNEGMLLTTINVNGMDIVIANVPAPVKQGAGHGAYPGATAGATGGVGALTGLSAAKKFSLGAIASAGGGASSPEAEVVVVGDVAGWSKIAAGGGGPLVLSGGAAGGAGECAAKSLVGVLASPLKRIKVDSEMQVMEGGRPGQPGNKCSGAMFAVSVGGAQT